MKSKFNLYVYNPNDEKVAVVACPDLAINIAIRYGHGSTVKYKRKMIWLVSDPVEGVGDGDGIIDHQLLIDREKKVLEDPKGYIYFPSVFPT